jgi:hypothetical protein
VVRLYFTYHKPKEVGAGTAVRAVINDGPEHASMPMEHDQRAKAMLFAQAICIRCRLVCILSCQASACIMQYSSSVPGGSMVAMGLFVCLLVAGVTNAHKAMHSCGRCCRVGVTPAQGQFTAKHGEVGQREDRKCPVLVFSGGEGAAFSTLCIREGTSAASKGPVVCGVVYHVDLPPCGQCCHMHILAASKHRF